MILYWYALVIGLIAVTTIALGFRHRSKTLVIYALVLPAFTSSPIITATRGSAGAIVASDMTGIFLAIMMLFFFPKEWKRPFKLKYQNYAIAILVCMMLSIFVTGLAYNFNAIDAEQQSRVNTVLGMPLPILMACFRFVKLLTLASYVLFFLQIEVDERVVSHVIKAFMVGAIIMAVSLIVTKLNIYDMSLTPSAYMNRDNFGSRILGTTKSITGRLLSVGLILSLLKLCEGNKLLSLAGLSSIALAIILSGSRGSLLAVAVSVMFIILLGRSRGMMIGLFGIIIVTAIGSYIIATNDVIAYKWTMTFDPEKFQTASVRTIVWTETLAYWLRNPLSVILGVGLFNYSYANTEGFFESAHNDFLTIVTELGITFGIIYFIIIFKLAKGYFKQIHTVSKHLRWRYVCIFSLLMGLIVAGMFEPTLYFTISGLSYIRIMFTLLIVCGLYPLDSQRNNAIEQTTPEQQPPNSVEEEKFVATW
ncbi:O-antigen ligase family protein [Planctomycetota bacterium]|nr:O-antigen ligase family protein [Planctomycetota bacterium]